MISIKEAKKNGFIFCPDFSQILLEEFWVIISELICHYMIKCKREPFKSHKNEV
jgi:hypothetical protein